MPGADATPMAQALALAARALTLSNPNPRVGCLLTAADGRVLGQGFTQQAGGPHAEVMALRDAAARGQDTRGATAWVTLEPCAHQGRTGPCCDALIAAGVARVVASLADPNPLTAGQGFARLRAAGVRVDVGPGAEAARELNLGFFSRMLRGLPWVRLKVAASLDGVTALANGQSQWITSPAAREDGQHWRARACAILSGVGTVLADDPRLDVRAFETPRQPHLALLDSRLRTPPNATIFRADRACWIYAAAPNDAGFDARRKALEARGATVLCLPAGQNGRVDPAAVLRDLAARGVNELHVEAGATVNGALLAADLVDELLLYLAPTLLAGGARGIADWGPLATLDQGLRLEWLGSQAMGPDLRLRARVQGRDRFPAPPTDPPSTMLIDTAK